LEQSLQVSQILENTTEREEGETGLEGTIGK
jgi:hypothetical protein